MFDYIKQTYKIGDAVKIKCSEGIYSGRIVFMSDNSIAIVDKNGQKHVVSGSDLIFCEDYKEESTPLEIDFDEFRSSEISKVPDYKTEARMESDMPMPQTKTATNESSKPAMWAPPSRPSTATTSPGARPNRRWIIVGALTSGQLMKVIPLPSM